MARRYSPTLFETLFDPNVLALFVCADSNLYDCDATAYRLLLLLEFCT